MAIGLRLTWRGRWCPQAVALGVLAMAAGAAIPAGEAALPDPTRPPDGVISWSVAGAAGVPAVPAEPRLQSVLIGASGRSAIIDGRQYKVGDKVGDARLVKISENEVVLTGSGGRQTMRLFPLVKKPPSAQDAPARRTALRNP